MGIITSTNTWNPLTIPKLKNSYYLKITNIYIAVVDIGDYRDGKMVFRVNVPEKFRGKGYGSTIFRNMLAELDKFKTPAYLEILPSGDMGYDELKEWYARCGFYPIGLGLYRRDPK